jgi:hypothetical protein
MLQDPSITVAQFSPARSTSKIPDNPAQILGRGLLHPFFLEGWFARQSFIVNGNYLTATLDPMNYGVSNLIRLQFPDSSKFDQLPLRADISSNHFVRAK